MIRRILTALLLLLLWFVLTAVILGWIILRMCPDSNPC
jgi:hypothetical protein